jgi:hypothetical protein
VDLVSSYVFEFEVEEKVDRFALSASVVAARWRAVGKRWCMRRSGGEAWWMRQSGGEVVADAAERRQSGEEVVVVGGRAVAKLWWRRMRWRGSRTQQAKRECFRSDKHLACLL